MRGKVYTVLQVGDFCRITPAYAGKRLYDADDISNY